MTNAGATLARCDLHVHSRFSTDSGNFALRRARLGESFTPPERVADVCQRRGMTFVTITDHNTLEGALRIADLEGAFLSVEVTTRFPEDDVPLHVLVWNLTKEDDRDLQEWRPSVYELVGFLRARGLVHALAHPLYRMGPPLTVSHVERMMLLFGIWEGCNGARPQEANELACRLASAVTPPYLEKLAERHGVEPVHAGRIALTGGSDDHGALDIATTWTEAQAADLPSFLAAIQAAESRPQGAHGSTTKLAHAIGSLVIHAYRESGGALPAPIGRELEQLFDSDVDDAEAHHGLIAELTARAARLLAAECRAGLGFQAMPDAGRRLAVLALAGALHLPYFATAHHHAGSRAGLRDLELGFFGEKRRGDALRVLVFTDTFAEANGVAGTMRRLADAGMHRSLPVSIVAAGDEDVGVLALEPEWETELPGYESLRLRFPSPRDVLELVEGEAPTLVHVATPGPVGACGLLAAKLLGLPVVGSWHTELGPYALHLTRDQLVADAFERYVEWFYRQCVLVLAPTNAVASALAGKGFAADRLRVWGRGVDAELFTPLRRSTELRARFAPDGGPLLLYVGRVSREKRLEVLLEAFGRLVAGRPGLCLAIVGDGPAREQLERTAPAGVAFLGELRGPELARVMRAPTSSASPAPPTPSDRCCSRLPAAVCRESRPPSEVRRSSFVTARLDCSWRRTTQVRSPRRSIRSSAIRPFGLDWARWRASGHSAGPGTDRTSSCSTRIVPRPPRSRRHRRQSPLDLVWQSSAMEARVERLFLPGFAAPAGLYRRGLPDGWLELNPPAFRETPDLDAFGDWIVREVERRPAPVWLGGHSMGGALAVLAASAVPNRVAGLTLVSPAGLPLTKSVRACASDFLRQLRAGLLPLRGVATSAVGTLRAPGAAIRVARRLRALDLTRELELVRAARIPAVVVGCTTDTLVTADHCRRIASVLGARYRELSLAGGHTWMLSAWPVLAAELAA